MESEPSRTQSPPPAALPPRSVVRKAWRFLADHPAGVLQGVFFALLAIVVLQNLEPTSLDVLFWSIPGLPKLVLVIVAMAFGAIAWEILSRWLFR